MASSKVMSVLGTDKHHRVGLAGVSGPGGKRIMI
jgi:hypothetical protein